MSIGGSGGWGGSDALGGGKGDNGGSDSRSAGQGPNRSDASLSGGSRSQAPSNGSNGNGNSNNNPAPTGQSMGALRAELDRRDRAAVAALGSSFRNVNVASDVFNDDEEGINSISEAIGRFGSWVQDRFGAGAPGGFAKSDVAGGLATVGGFLAGGGLGAAAAGVAHTAYAAPPGNRIGMLSSVIGRLGSAVPGVGGLITSAAGLGVGLVDEYVTDLDKVATVGAGSSLASAYGQAGQLKGLYPGGGQGGDKIADISEPAVIAGPPKEATTPTVNPNTVRRTLSNPNLRFARLRGIPSVSDYL
ncbi:hypothetical protein [Rosistilla oblonga]|uniref:hypothetical protein n=1 Tax=Rosistilla oblonga TaxID=2527990 RepID=UPI003A984776